MEVKFVHVNLIARDWKLLSDFYQCVFNCEPVLPEKMRRDGAFGRSVLQQWFPDV